MLPLALIGRDADGTSASGYHASLSVQALFAEVYSLAHIVEAFLVFMVISVALRMYVRLKITRQFGPEDWSMVVTLIFMLAQSSLSVAACYLCLGLFKGTTYVEVYSWVNRCAGVFYVLTMMALKVSLGFFFLNIFLHRKLQTVLIRIIMGSTIVVGLVYFPVGFLTCAEIKASSGYTSTCSRTMQTAASTLFDIFSLVNIVGDLLLAIMSCTAIWEATLPIAAKFSASGLLIMGCIGAIASAIRLGLVVAPVNPSRYTQELIDIYKWCVVEIGVCVIAVNLVMIRPLFNMMLISMGIMSKPTTNLGATIGGSNQKPRRTKTHDAELDEASLTHFTEGDKGMAVTVSDEEKGLDENMHH